MDSSGSPSPDSTLDWQICHSKANGTCETLNTHLIYNAINNNAFIMIFDHKNLKYNWMIMVKLSSFWDFRFSRFQHSKISFSLSIFHSLALPSSCGFVIKHKIKFSRDWQTKGKRQRTSNKGVSERRGRGIANRILWINFAFGWTRWYLTHIECLPRFIASLSANKVILHFLGNGNRLLYRLSHSHFVQARDIHSKIHSKLKFDKASLRMGNANQIFF